MTVYRSVLVAAALASGGIAQAASYDAVASFGATPTVFSYGTGVTGATFVDNLHFEAVCSGDARIACFQAANPVARVPFVAKNLTGTTIDAYDTVVMPTDVLNVHPGIDTDSIVRFTAPTTGSYKVSGSFELLDVNPTGVRVAVYAAGTLRTQAILTGPAAMFPATVTSSFSFSPTVFLAAGQTIDFGVNNLGNFSNDSTGLSATINAVPEPAAWALMVIGFGLVGLGLRSRTRAVAA